MYHGQHHLHPSPRNRHMVKQTSPNGSCLIASLFLPNGAIPRTMANIIINLLTHAPSNRPIMWICSDKLTWIHWQFPRDRFMFLYRCFQANPQLLPGQPQNQATPRTSVRTRTSKAKNKRRQAQPPTTRPVTSASASHQGSIPHRCDPPTTLNNLHC
jgi:hypothetical protein